MLLPGLSINPLWSRRTITTRAADRAPGPPRRLRNDQAGAAEDVQPEGGDGGGGDTAPYALAQPAPAS